MVRAEIEGIKREAGIERESRIAVLFVVIFGSVFTMLALFVQLMAIKSEYGMDRTLSIGISVLTIILSWLLIHTVFALYYAHEFHNEGHSGARGLGGGLEFPDDRTPDYLDFLYFSFTIGMTFQVSDVQIESHRLRRTALAHGVLAFFFNVVILALTINIVAGLI